MEKTKTVLDREPITSEYISSRQDFSKVVSGYKTLKVPVWKSAWFYGTAGLATIAIVTSVVLYNPDSHIPVKEEAQKTAVTTTESRPERPVVKPKSTLIAQAEPVNKDNSMVPREGESAVSNNHDQHVSSDSDKAVEEQAEEELDEEALRLSEEKEIAEEEPQAEVSIQNMLPNISGFYHGEIPYFRLCDGKGLQVNDDLAITSFKVQFYVGRKSIEQTVRGNRIPSELCEAITMNSLGSTVFFTEIRAEHRVTGRSTHLNSMNLIPVN